MNFVIRRMGAYLIDFVFIFLFLTMVNQIRFLNPTFEEYAETYDEYMVLLDDLSVDNVSEVAKSDEYININYNLGKYSVSISIISIVVYFVYFWGFQMWNKGQTLGKKVFNLQVVSNDDKKAKWWQMLLRSVIAYNLILEILLVISLFIFSPGDYMVVSGIFSIIAMIIFYANAIFIIFRKDGRGIHDLLVGTKVVEMRINNGN